MNETATFSLLSAILGWIIGYQMARPWGGLIRRRTRAGADVERLGRELAAAIAELQAPKPRFGERGDIDRGYPVEA